MRCHGAFIQVDTSVSRRSHFKPHSPEASRLQARLGLRSFPDIASNRTPTIRYLIVDISLINQPRLRARPTYQQPGTQSSKSPAARILSVLTKSRDAKHTREIRTTMNVVQTLQASLAIQYSKSRRAVQMLRSGAPNVRWAAYSGSSTWHLEIFGVRASGEPDTVHVCIAWELG